MGIIKYVKELFAPKKVETPVAFPVITANNKPSVKPATTRKPKAKKETTKK